MKYQRMIVAISMPRVCANLLMCLFALPCGSFAEDHFADTIAPILSKHCIECHDHANSKGGLSLATAESLQKGGDSGPVVQVGRPAESLLIEMISGEEPEMPKDAKPLTAPEIEALANWIQQGADWTKGFKVKPWAVNDTDWWSLKQLRPVAAPKVSVEDNAWVRNPIDQFILAKLRSQNLSPSKTADRRTLARRLYFDLIGLPPSPQQMQAFLNDASPNAYAKLVDELLASKHYGERWARHWLDVVHYGDTHGYDKDKPRPNAWPYRDYVIRSFNRDKPWSRFVMEQIAGDVLWPETRDGIEATGFIAAGPWDFIGHAEVPETKIDGKVARHLDRDDMVTSTMNTFISTTVQCARCHNHKFDPITQEHYYSLQSVFAALDRADREYDYDPKVQRQRVELEKKLSALAIEKLEYKQLVKKQGGEPLAQLEKQIEIATKQAESKARPEFGYHSQISASQDTPKWVQVDLGSDFELTSIAIVGCKDDFNGIGEGFGFPVRFKIEVGFDREFKKSDIIVDHTDDDFPNPKVSPVEFALDNRKARFIRVTATKLALRQNDYIFALAELIAKDANQKHVSSGAKVESLDSIEAPVRWQRKNLVDGYFFGVTNNQQVQQDLARLQQERASLVGDILGTEREERLAQIASEEKELQTQIEALPMRQKVYAGVIHKGSGAFRGTGHDGGKPRVIRVLHRGNVLSPGEIVQPGTVPFIDGQPWQFDLTTGHHEGERRVALAKWLVKENNFIAWRSIVNRIWSYHFGQGIVDSPNDFGRMGELPSHPQLLDWLAIQFRDNGGSIKNLHRLIVHSNTYRQASAHRPEMAKADASNKYYWRMNRRVLDAESIRDAVLAVSGKLNPKMYGPGFRDFVLERPEHSPHYEYHKHDPNDKSTHRRSVYRFLVRSQQNPFMQTLDCADPSQSVPKRGTTLTSVQALTLLNNKFMVSMAEHFADRLKALAGSPKSQIALAFEIALGRSPTKDECQAFAKYVEQFGLANACRVVFNLNEFVFID